MFNPCFLKQSKNKYFVCSTTNNRKFSDVYHYLKHSESKCLQINYISDYESYSVTATNFVIINNLSNFNSMKHTKTRHEAYIDND